VLVAVTDHAAERYRQRVRGTLDAKAEITERVVRAREAGRTEAGERPGDLLVRDVRDRSLVYVCREDVPRGELVVVTLWEEGEDARVPRRYTDALRRLSVAPVVAGAVLAGCGGEDPLTAAEYRRELRRVCTAEARRTEALRPPPTTRAGDVADYLGRLLEAGERRADAIEALAPPDDLRDAHEQLAEAERDAAEEVERLAGELREDGADARGLLAGAEPRLAELSRARAEAARTLRVRSCADG
jgi:hypothetical protein